MLHGRQMGGIMDITREEATSRRRTFAQWAGAAYEPLLPMVTRVDIDRRMREWTRRTPTFTIAWATGVAATIIDTLPPSDPWRRPHPGFGTFRDAADVTFTPDEDDDWSRDRLLLDINLAAGRRLEPRPAAAGHQPRSRRRSAAAGGRPGAGCLRRRSRGRTVRPHRAPQPGRVPPRRHHCRHRPGDRAVVTVATPRLHRAGRRVPPVDDVRLAVLCQRRRRRTTHPA